MPRRKQELTPEEKLQQEKQSQLNEIQREIPFVNEPSYYFQIGDKVRYGNFQQSIVDEILYEGKAYGLKCTTTWNDHGDTYDYEAYRTVTWVEIRPLTNGDTHFAENQDIRMNFYSSTVDSLLNKYYHFGIDFDPVYQRDYIWDDTDKELLIDSIFKNIDIGKYAFIHLSNAEWHKRGFSYEILDGKQRLSTIIQFYENKLAYKGKFYNDLSWQDQHVFRNHPVSVADVDEIDKQTTLRYFLMLNRTGKVMDESHLKRVEQLLKEM